MRIVKIKISIMERDEFESMQELGLPTGEELPSEHPTDAYVDLDKVSAVWGDDNGKICIHFQGGSFWTDSYTLDEFYKVWNK